MAKGRIIALSALILLAFSVSVTPTALSEEKGKVTGREVWFATDFQSANVPDVEGHTIYLYKFKGIFFSEKWGNGLATMSCTSDLIKGVGPLEGYTQWTYSDGSTTVIKWKGEQKGAGAGVTGGAGGESTWSYVKGTGKFAGIKGGGTSKFWILGPGQVYTDMEGQYTLP